MMLFWALVTTAVGAGLRGAADAGEVRAAALNAASRAAVIINMRKERLLSCGHRERWRLTKPRKEQIPHDPSRKRSGNR
jgi:hypothetical protein